MENNFKKTDEEKLLELLLNESSYGNSIERKNEHSVLHHRYDPDAGFVVNRKTSFDEDGGITVIEQKHLYILDCGHVVGNSQELRARCAKCHSLLCTLCDVSCRRCFQKICAKCSLQYMEIRYCRFCGLLVIAKRAVSALHRLFSAEI